MAKKPIIAVLGAGNGGFCTAADLTLRDYEVRLYEFPSFANSLDPVIKHGGIRLRGVAGEGFARPALITTDIEAALDQADLVLVIVPSTGHRMAARACAPYLTDNQIVILIPGNCGGVFEFRRELLAHGGLPGITLAETTNLMYAVKKENDNGVWARGLKYNLPLAAFPSYQTSAVLETMQMIYPQFVPALNVLDTGFNCHNCIVHPPGMLGNLGFIQNNPHKTWYFYKDGYTQGIAAIAEQIDAERLDIIRAFGLPEVKAVEALHGFYQHQGLNGDNLYEVFSKSPIHHAAKGPDTVHHRMLIEDVPYGLVPLTEFARLVNVKTPFMDAIIRLSSAVCETDFHQNGRTLDKLGLDGMSPEEVLRFMDSGVSEKAMDSAI
jgi:opine dehydrogenase